MQREDVEDVFARLPDIEHARVHFVMSGVNVSVETLMRLEPTYAVIRGREAGNQEEGRVFFLPYEAIISMKLEREVNAREINEWYNDTAGVAKRDVNGTVPAADKILDIPVQQQMDPAEIARQNLLERIRATRSLIRKN